MKVLLSVLLLGLAAISFGVEHYTLPANKPLNLPFSDAVRLGDQVYVSGAIGVEPGTGNIVSGGIEAETKRTMDNIGLVLKRWGLDHSHLVRCQVMLEDIADWPAFNKVYKQYFKPPFPARSAFAAAGLALGAKVEVECMAWIPPYPFTPKPKK